MKRLIVNADDLGRSPGIDRGIVRAHERGIVTSTTLMANAPGAQRAATLVRRTPTLDVGVHLVLTYARPLTDPALIPSLVEPDGSFPRSPSAIVGEGRVDGEEALVEYRAQFARAKELLGTDPSHVDTHHWVHDDPALEWAVGELARETGAVARQHDAAQRERLRARGVRTPDRFCRAFQHGDNVAVPSLLRILATIASDGDGTTELMCHPGEEGDSELLATSSYARERPVELATLTDPRVRAALEEHGLVLSSFRDLA
ncbi:MAG TPA: ChbG/HpnK family deacetylase [Candidatus Limnocylindria bacterium]|nr:ChbG/HpnK family deacetylase [Candidatus Limnocylindria bacterium]